MRANSIARLYDNLTVDERFRLRIQAFARRDLIECERLDRACPQKDYRAYCARVDASDSLTLIMLVDMLPKLAKLTMIDALRPVIEHLEGKLRDAVMVGYLKGRAAGWTAAGKRREPPAVTDDDLGAVADDALQSAPCFTELLDQIAADIAARARTPRDGLAQFAEARMGLPFDVLLDAWGAHSRWTLDTHAAALDAAPPNPADLEMLTRVLDLAWRRHGLLDSNAEPDDVLREAMRSEGWP